MIAGPKTLISLVAAGWLAEALASTNANIDAGVAAYNSGDFEAALTSYTAAEGDLGERPELHFNKGLALLAKDDKEGARKAFEHGTESEHANVASSAEYELGNLELDAEAFEAAIERYKKCLILRPDHASAKWNLELALLKKKQKEDEEKKKEDEKKDDEKKDEDKKEEDKKDDEKKEEDKKDEKKEEDKKDEKKEEDKKEEDKKDEEKKKEDEKKQDEQKKPDEKKQDEQKQPEPQPQPLNKADLDKALEQLDNEDPFALGRPQGRQVPVEKDW
jgi:Ca-activated chloride channel family protein